MRKSAVIVNTLDILIKQDQPMPMFLQLRYLYLLVDQETQQDPVVLEIQHLLSVQVLQVHLSHLADHQGPIGDRI